MQPVHQRAVPLSWPHYWSHPTRLQKFLIGFPGIGIDNKTWRELRRHVSQRDVSVLAVWDERPEINWIRIRASEIIQTVLEWPHPYFVPDDPCEILFWDPTMDMRVEEAMHVFNDEFSLTCSVWTDLKIVTLGELVDRIATMNDGDFS